MPIKELHEDIIKKRNKAAKFYSGDIHVHSPKSFDGKKSIKDIDSFLNYVKDNNGFPKIEIIGFTDHMIISETKDFISTQKDDSIFCISGMELNIILNDSTNKRYFHLLFLADETFNKTLATQMLRYTNLNPNLPSCDEINEDIYDKYYFEFSGIGEFKNFLKEFSEYGIFLWSHWNNPSRGFRDYCREDNKDALCIYHNGTEIDTYTYDRVKELKDDGLVVGVQLNKVDPRIKDKVLGKFLSSDAHDPAQIGQSDKITFYKMSKCSFNGIKKSFQYYKNRIRYTGLNPKYPKILGIRFNGGFLDKQVFGFSDDLTAIIGGRGSGKTTILEGIRIIFGKNEDYIRLINKRGKKILSVIDDRMLGLQSAALQNTTIEVIYETKNNSFYLSAVIPPPKEGKKDLEIEQLKDVKTKIYDLDNNPSNLKINNDEFRIEYFGWSEIESLGLDKKEQLELIDGYIDTKDTDILNIKDKIEEIKKDIEIPEEKISGISSIDSQINDLLIDLNKKYESIADFFYYKRQYEKLVVQYPDFLETHKSIIKNKDEISEIKKMINDYFFQKIDNKNLGFLLQKISESDYLKNVFKYIDDFKNSFEKYESETEKLLKTIRLEELNLEEKLNNLEKDIRDSGIIGEYENSINKIEQVLIVFDKWGNLSSLYNDYNNDFKMLISLLEQREKKFGELIILKGKLTKLRIDAISKINERLKDYKSGDTEMIIEINEIDPDEKKDFLFKYNTSDLIEFLNNSFLSTEVAGHYKEMKVAERITKCIENNVNNFIKLLMNYDKLGIDLTCEIKIIDNGDIDEKIKGKRSLIQNELTEKKEPTDTERIFSFNIKNFDMIHNLSPLLIDDKINIKLGKNLIEKSSPGQRVSTILPIIFLASKVPLIIDQPEDNLDNNLIKNNIVNILSDLKINRQIIIATHNANMVVLGDAEQVIVMKAINEKSGIAEFEGFIDEKIIADNVVALLEGGKQAFQERELFYKMNQII